MCIRDSYVRVDRTRKVPITVLIRALGIGTNAEIVDLFGEEPKILASFTKDTSTNYQEGLLELYKKIRPGEPLAVDEETYKSAKMCFDNGFYRDRHEIDGCWKNKNPFDKLV